MSVWDGRETAAWQPGKLTAAENGADASPREGKDEVLRRDHLEDLRTFAQEGQLARRIDLIVRIKLSLESEARASVSSEQRTGLPPPPDRAIV